LERANHERRTSLLNIMLARRRRQVAAGTCVVLIMELMEDGVSCSEEELASLKRRTRAAAAILKQLMHTRPGSGHSLLPRLPTLSLPKSGDFDLYVQLPDTFKSECGCTPSEFLEQLLPGVMDVMELTRDVDGAYGPELNKLRRKRRFKYSARERLFNFLRYCRQYQSLQRTADKHRLCKTAHYVDFAWLRMNLVAHPFLVSKVSWGTPAEREQQRQDLVTAGAQA
jgi:hypothetical protein